MSVRKSEHVISREAALAPIKETYNFSHGIHRYELRSGETVTTVSARTWAEYTDYLSRISDKDKLVVSPELMTFSERPLAEVAGARQSIRARVEEVKEISEKHPQATFLLGTPTFPEAGKPRNSVVYIRNGELIGSTSKRAPVTSEEAKHFDFPAEEPPAFVPGTEIGILICGDLAAATMYLRSDSPSERVLRLAGRDNLIGKNPTFLHPRAESLLLVSCWGVGGDRAAIKPGEADKYYRLQLSAIGKQVLKRSPVEEIVVVDRTPLVEDELKPVTPTKPYNALLRMEV